MAVCVLGDRDVNETKLGKLYKATEVELADFELVTEVTGASVGFAGPIGLKIDVLVDFEIEGLRNFIIGANEDDYHFINTNFSDFEVTQFADISNVKEGDPNPEGEGSLHFTKGIEVGNTFKLGTDYSKAMNLEYLDQNNQLQDVFMGSYGIGIGRTLAALVEQNHDDKGIVWPINLAPYPVAIVLINSKNEVHLEYATNLYKELKSKGIDVIFDDRKARPGVKFNDIDLIGIPLRITIGRDLDEGQLEFKERSKDDSVKVSVDEIVEHIQSFL